MKEVISDDIVVCDMMIKAFIICTPCINYVQYERGCAVLIRHIFSTSEDVQYESGISSVEARMCSTSVAHLQYERGYAVRA